MIIGDGIMLGAGGESASIFVTGLSETDTVTAVHKKTVQVPNPDYIGLPDGYTQLEYIESTGTQYIDTGLSLVSSYQMTKSVTRGYGWIYGVDNYSSSVGSCSLNTRSDNTIGVQWGSLWVSADATISCDVTSKIDITRISDGSNTRIIIGNDVKTLTSSDYKENSNSIYLFARNNDASGTPVFASQALELFSLSMYTDQNVCVRNFIPAKRISDSAIGLYDLVNNVFYTNAGTGTFTAGSEIPAYIEMTVDDKTLTGKWTQKPNPVLHGLPDGYTELEYIESTGTQYIDTEFKPNGTTKIVCDFQMVNQGTEQQGVFGSRPGESRRFSLFTGNGTNKLQVDYDTSETLAVSGNSISGLNLNNRNTIEVSNSLIINGNTIKTVSAVPFTSTYNLFLFANNNVGTAQLLGTLKLYSCQIYDNGLLVRDFIPCKKVDGTVGMLDNVNSVFYGNAGTGVFTAGAEVPKTIEGFLIGKIKDYGTYTVTATNGTKTATQDVLVDSATQYDIELEYKLWLYRDGDECEYATGGWVGTDGGYYASGNYTSGVKTANSLLLDGSTDGGYDKYLGTNYAIDFTNYSVLKCERIAVTANAFQPYIRVLGDNGRYCDSSNAIVTVGGTISNQVEILEADVSSVTGAHYVVVACTSSSGKGYVYKVWLE